MQTTTTTTATTSRTPSIPNWRGIPAAQHRETVFSRTAIESGRMYLCEQQKDKKKSACMAFGAEDVLLSEYMECEYFWTTSSTRYDTQLWIVLEEFASSGWCVCVCVCVSE